MAISAVLSRSGTTGDRTRPSRLTLRLEVAGERESGEATSVLIHNASATGLLLECETPIEEGERIAVDLPHAGPTPARIVWRSGKLHGCRFDEPLSQAALSAAQLRSVTGEGIAPRAPAPQGSPLSARLRELRKARGLTLAELATMLSVSKPTVWAWEHGKARPLDSRLDDLAGALGVDPTALTSQESGRVPADVLDRCRTRIAEAAGVSPASVRILIEL